MIDVQRMKIHFTIIGAILMLQFGCKSKPDPRLDGAWQSNREDTVANAFRLFPEIKENSPENIEKLKDIRVEQYLPRRAEQISIYKEPHSNGYRARYSISEANLLAYIDSLWGDSEKTTDGERFFESGSPASAEDIARVFGDLDWKHASTVA